MSEMASLLPWTREFDLLYNCSYDVDAVPLEQRRHPIVGCILIVLTVIYEVAACSILVFAVRPFNYPRWFQIAYIPCLSVFWRQMKASSCYKIMFYLGICDVINLVIVGFFMAAVTINGWVYCSHPTLMYWTGKLGPGK